MHRWFDLNSRILIHDSLLQKLKKTVKRRFILSVPKFRRADIGLGPPIEQHAVFMIFLI